jgi:small subunit ribosomal protein S13
MVLRIAGINLDNEKRVEIALTYIYGIGRTKSAEILSRLKITLGTKVKDLTPDEESKLRVAIEKDSLVEGDLRREVSMDIKRLKDIGSYRGTRHAHKLPVRGQRTKTNARTKRGKRVTMGSGRKKSSDKT